MEGAGSDGTGSFTKAGHNTGEERTQRAQTHAFCSSIWKDAPRREQYRANKTERKRQENLDRDCRWPGCRCGQRRVVLPRFAGILGGCTHYFAIEYVARFLRGPGILCASGEQRFSGHTFVACGPNIGTVLLCDETQLRQR